MFFFFSDFDVQIIIGIIPINVTTVSLKLVITPLIHRNLYEGVSKSFRTDCLEQELQMVQPLPLGAIISLFCESV
jgi:hypothetical protein